MLWVHPERRLTLEKAAALDPRVSVLDEEFDEAVIEMEAGQAAQQAAALLAKVQAQAKAAPTRGEPRRRRWAWRGKRPNGCTSSTCSNPLQV